MATSTGFEGTVREMVVEDSCSDSLDVLNCTVNNIHTVDSTECFPNTQIYVESIISIHRLRFLLFVRQKKFRDCYISDALSIHLKDNKLTQSNL